MKTAYRSLRRVEFHDTDMAGIVHFSNFFRFMEEAEVGFLRHLGLGVSWRPGGQKFGFPRVSATCDFVKPARFEDVLEICVFVEKIGRKSITYAHEFRLGEDVIARGKITCVCCLVHGDNQIEAIEIPDEVRAKLEAASG
jgi:YbgC/YbaW family acyl-CoA thioester hydrolase